MGFSKAGSWICFYLLIGFLSPHTAQAQKPFKIFLVGDAGDSKESGKTLVNLEKELIKNPNSAIVFLGDNSYRDILWGLVHFGYRGFDSTKNTIDKVLSQLDILNKYQGSVYFVPGNHDWWNLDYKKGKPKLAMEQAFIQKNLKLNKNIANPDNVFLPENGDYGPAFVELNNQTIRLVFIDTYRVIQSGLDKKGKNVPAGEKIFYERLDSVIMEGYERNENVMVLAHHPIHAVGPYSKQLKRPYLFGRIKSSMANFPSYQAMAKKINSILSRYPDIFYASGHIHALQYFYTKNSIHYIVSGAGSNEKILNVKNIHKYDANEVTNEFLLWNTGGFFEVEFNGQSIQTILHYENGTLKCSIE